MHIPSPPPFQRRPARPDDGFTLTELLIALAVLTLLLSTILFGGQRYRARAYDVAAMNCAREIKTMQAQELSDKGRYSDLPLGSIQARPACNDLIVTAAQTTARGLTNPTADQARTGVTGGGASNAYLYYVRHPGGLNSYVATETDLEKSNLMSATSLTLANNTVVAAGGGTIPPAWPTTAVTPGRARITVSLTIPPGGPFSRQTASLRYNGFNSIGNGVCTGNPCLKTIEVTPGPISVTTTITSRLPTGFGGPEVDYYRFNFNSPSGPASFASGSYQNTQMAGGANYTLAAGDDLQIEATATPLEAFVFYHNNGSSPWSINIDPRRSSGQFTTAAGCGSTEMNTGNILDCGTFHNWIEFDHAGVTKYFTSGPAADTKIRGCTGLLHGNLTGYYNGCNSGLFSSAPVMEFSNTSGINVPANSRFVFRFTGIGDSRINNLLSVVFPYYRYDVASGSAAPTALNLELVTATYEPTAVRDMTAKTITVPVSVAVGDTEVGAVQRILNRNIGPCSVRMTVEADASNSVLSGNYRTVMPGDTVNVDVTRVSGTCT